MSELCMDTSDYKCRPAFDFAAGESSVVLHQGRAEIYIDGNTYMVGNGEVRLELLPRARVCLYGHFDELSQELALKLLIEPKTNSSFSINGRWVEGSAVNVDETNQKIVVKWCPSSESIVGVGDEST